MSRFVPGTEPDVSTQRYLVIRTLGEEAIPGMGDVEFVFTFLCINAEGRRCMVWETYIQYNGPEAHQGYDCVESDQLCLWRFRLLPQEETGADEATDRALYQARSGELLLPPFAPQLRKGSHGAGNAPG